MRIRHSQPHDVYAIFFSAGSDDEVAIVGLGDRVAHAAPFWKLRSH